MDVWEQSQTVDPEVRAYIYSLVNAVGGQSTLEDRYSIGDDALAVLNDLRRWLQLYDEKTNRFDVKRCLAEANLVKGDLLEILALWSEEQQENKLKAKLAFACLQLLVPLTWPIELNEEKTTRNHLRHAPYLRLAQVGYKRAILQYEDAKILRTAIRIGLPSMAQERRERTARDEGTIRFILYFLRNIAIITQPQELPSQGDENEISRSSTIDAFHEQDAFSLLLTVASGAADDFVEQDVVVLQTLFNLLKGVDPKKLFLEESQLAKQETSELQNLIQKEKAMLSSYKKHAPTRHNRFGTMLWVKRGDDKVSTVSGQDTITNDSTTLIHMDKSKKWDRPRQRGRRVDDDLKEHEGIGRTVDLTDRARRHLRTFVEDFLDSGFNPMFVSLRKAIEREAERVGETIKRQYFYLISWFLAAEGARRDCSKARRTSAQGMAGDNTYAYIAAVLDQETFVLINRNMQTALDEKAWRDLQSILRCFTQILLTVQSMADSEDEEDQEIAENIQNRIFYEESTQDRLVSILRGYKSQGLAYLDAVTDCVHVFVRMLEKYSKQNVDLQIRSKRRARRKKKKAQQEQQPQTGGEGEENDNDNEDNEDEVDEEADAMYTLTERKFDFTRFSGKFLSQPCIDTFISFLHFYADLSADQLKRCHRYFYRLAFKNEMAVLLFRVDVLALLHKMIKGPGALSAEAEGYKEWETLVQQVFRRCIKWVERKQDGGDGSWREIAVVEMLFSKASGTVYYLQNGFDRVVEKRAPRPPAELEVKASVQLEERVGVVVSVMLELGKGDELQWVKQELKRAVEERQAWEDAQEAQDQMAQDAGTDDAAAAAGSKPLAPTIFINPDTEERKDALFKNKYLRLLLTTAGLERLGAAEDVDASWVVPSELSSKQLKDVVDRIQKTEFDPPTFEEGTMARDLIRNKSAGRQGAIFDDSESGSDREIEDAQFPPNLREKRKQHGDEEDEGSKKRRRLTRRNQVELTEEEAQARAKERRQREIERNNKIKSQLFVTASDDESDEEADAQFFRLEEERRRNMKGVIRNALLKEAAEGQKGKKRQGDKKGDGKKAKKPRRTSGASDNEIELDVEQSDSDVAAPIQLSSDDESESDSEADEARDAASDDDSQRREDMVVDEETPSTSPTPLETDLPLNEVSANLTGALRDMVDKRADVGTNDDDEEDEGPVVKSTARRRVRAGFVIDSDSE
ncbi:timeless protein-domain-containing protein [Neohortaea acidophila]|uniref:Topoisomerase 1-associated factor 1 n=1 Tax=Neohortaea acidophila TaxID=245834 RepID=A0A6A6Q6I9_9PEZI|nr:timeless protein-domain-containing protein [Neohortaea acidophila]KAF2488000.1 timeless protein-domain-containing protein [Neohortaea acidophila]